MVYLRALAVAAFMLIALACAGSPNPERSAALQSEIDALRVALDAARAEIDEAAALLETCTCPPPAAAEPAPNSQPAPAITGTGPAELEVKSTSTIKIMVDGKGVPYNLARGGYYKRDIPPGSHLVEVQSSSRTVMWSETVTFPPGTRVRFQHKLGRRYLEPLTPVPVD